MKPLKIVFVVCFICISIISIFLYFNMKEVQSNNSELITETISSELKKALSKNQTDVFSKDTNQVLELPERTQLQQQFDSLSNKLRNSYLPQTPKFGGLDKRRDAEEKQKNESLTLAAIKAQMKTDSLENVVRELSQMVKSNIILTNQVQSKTLSEVSKAPKAIKPYYENVNIIFRTRQSFITAKVDQQSFSNFQYGQVFHFENSIPEYMLSFTDSKGIALSGEAAKKFLQQKSFLVNSIDLKNHDAVVKCSQNM